MVSDRYVGFNCWRFAGTLLGVCKHPPFPLNPHHRLTRACFGSAPWMICLPVFIARRSSCPHPKGFSWLLETAEPPLLHMTILGVSDCEGLPASSRPVASVSCDGVCMCASLVILAYPRHAAESVAEALCWRDRHSPGGDTGRTSCLEETQFGGDRGTPIFARVVVLSLVDNQGVSMPP